MALNQHWVHALMQTRAYDYLRRSLRSPRAANHLRALGGWTTPAYRYFDGPVTAHSGVEALARMVREDREFVRGAVRCGLPPLVAADALGGYLRPNEECVPADDLQAVWLYMAVAGHQVWEHAQLRAALVGARVELAHRRAGRWVLGVRARSWLAGRRA